MLALAGGIGGAKLANGLAQVLPPDALCIAVNTGDDFEHLGFHISPDLDTVMYTLAGINNRALGWGIAGETWSFMDALERLGGASWFRLGDRDLATHVERRARLHAGESLSQVTARLCERLGLKHRIVPMSDDAVRTIVQTPDGPLAFQDYFVRLRAGPRVISLDYRGAQSARPSAGFVEALNAASAIVICPSNPFLSVAPMLAVSGVRERLAQRRVPAIAVSPIVGGKAIKGPAAKIMRELGHEPSALEVAKFYAGLIDAIVIDRVDTALATPIRALGIEVLIADTIMSDERAQAALAEKTCAFAATLVQPALTS
jgi:LPPG:FO 2-phospho-L-lactate transferase